MVYGSGVGAASSDAKTGSDFVREAERGLEEDNDRELDLLVSKVDEMRSVSHSLREEATSQNALLDSMTVHMDTAKTMVGGVAKRVDSLLHDDSHFGMGKLVLLMTLAIVTVYVIGKYIILIFYWLILWLLGYTSSSKVVNTSNSTTENGLNS